MLHGNTDDELPVPSQTVLAGSFEPVPAAYPEKVGFQEVGTFLCLPWKRNGAAGAISAAAPESSKVVSSLSKAIIPSFARIEEVLESTHISDVAGKGPAAADKAAFLDFRDVFGAVVADQGSPDDNEGMNDQKYGLLNHLRIHAGAPEKSQLGVEKLLNYYSLLTKIDDRIGFEIVDMHANFVWFEAFAPEKKVANSCIQYEKAAALYNLAALYSQLGAHSRFSTEEGLKAAAMFFQKSATVLHFIRDTLSGRYQFKLDKASDVSESSLTAASFFMLAQAQECFYEKASLNQCSSNLTSMIAIQTADFYELAYRHSKANSAFARASFPRAWTSHMKAKALLFEAVAHFHAPTSQNAQYALGERIARLRSAKQLVGKALKSARASGEILARKVDGYLATVAKAAVIAEQKNFHEFHQIVFDVRLLPPIKRPSQALVTVLAFADVFGDLGRFPDIFAGVGHHFVVDGEWGQLSMSAEDKAGFLAKTADELDARIKELKLSTLSGILSTTKESLEKPIGARLADLVDKIIGFQIEEEVIKLSELVESGAKLAVMQQSMVNEINYRLDNVDSEKFMNTPESFQKIDATRTRAKALAGALAAKWAAIASLKMEYDTDLSDFSPASWNEDRLRSITSIGHVREQLVEASAQSVERVNRRTAEMQARLEQLRDKVVAFQQKAGPSAVEFEAFAAMVNTAKGELCKDIKSMAKETFAEKTSIAEYNSTKDVLESFETTVQQYERCRFSATVLVEEMGALKAEVADVHAASAALPLGSSAAASAPPAVVIAADAAATTAQRQQRARLVQRNSTLKSMLVEMNVFKPEPVVEAAVVDNDEFFDCQASRRVSAASFFALPTQKAPRRASGAGVRASSGFMPANMAAVPVVDNQLKDRFSKLMSRKPVPASAAPVKGAAPMQAAATQKQQIENSLILDKLRTVQAENDLLRRRVEHTEEYTQRIADLLATVDAQAGKIVALERENSRLVRIASSADVGGASESKDPAAKKVVKSKVSKTLYYKGAPASSSLGSSASSSSAAELNRLDSGVHTEGNIGSKKSPLYKQRTVRSVSVPNKEPHDPVLRDAFSKMKQENERIVGRMFS